MSSKYTLPQTAVIVSIVEDTDTTESGIFIGKEKAPKTEATGVILVAGENHQHLIGKKVYYRSAYGDKITVEGKEVIFLRDLNTSMYFVEEI